MIVFLKRIITYHMVSYFFLDVTFTQISTLIVFATLVTRNFTNFKRNIILACCGTSICSSIIMNTFVSFYGGIIIEQEGIIKKVPIQTLISSVVIQMMIKLFIAYLAFMNKSKLAQALLPYPPSV